MLNQNYYMKKQNTKTHEMQKNKNYLNGWPENVFWLHFDSMSQKFWKSDSLSTFVIWSLDKNLSDGQVFRQWKLLRKNFNESQIKQTNKQTILLSNHNKRPYLLATATGELINQWHPVTSVIVHDLLPKKRWMNFATAEQAKNQIPLCENCIEITVYNVYIKLLGQ